MERKFMKNHGSKFFAEIYRLLPVIGILLLALLGIWWGSRTAAAVQPVQLPDSESISSAARDGTR